MSTSAFAVMPYPDVNAVLGLLLPGVKHILGEQFVGMYLYGSLAGGDFDPQRSDIDFVVVTADEVRQDLLQALELMHKRVALSGLRLATKLEGSYISQRALRRYDPTDVARPTLNEGQFYLSPHGPDWVIQRHIIREQGVVVTGPPPHSVIDPVEPADLRWAVRAFVEQWWRPMLEVPARLQTSEYQAYAVQTMCRVLYTLQHGAVASKAASARWAQSAVAEQWAELIGRALDWRPGKQMDGLAQTLELMRFTVGFCRAWLDDSD